jgi:hypothetical protein
MRGRTSRRCPPVEPADAGSDSGCQRPARSELCASRGCGATRRHGEGARALAGRSRGRGRPRPARRERLHLCWREGDDCSEVVVRLDAVQPRAITEVDVATYLARPLGALHVDFGRHAGSSCLQCVRTDAEPPLLPLQLSLSATTPRHLLGIRAGTYRLQWRPSFLAPATHTVEVRLHGGHNALFVDDVLRQRQPFTRRRGRRWAVLRPAGAPRSARAGGAPCRLRRAARALQRAPHTRSR